VLSLTREDLDDVASARRYLALASVVDEIVGRLVGLGIANTKGLKVTPLAQGYGRYVALPQAIFWIGVDHESWAQHGRGPLWVRFSDESLAGAQVSKALRAWLHTVPPKALRDDAEGMLLVPLPLRAGVSKDQVVADHVEFFRQLAAALANAGMVDLRRLPDVAP
jgi:hypothetical protein